MDPDTKLMVSWMVGDWDADSALVFIDDLSRRLANRAQLTTDGNKAYLTAVEKSFDGEVDYAMLVKLYGAPMGKENERRYSPAECNGTIKGAVTAILRKPIYPPVMWSAKT